MQTVMSILSPVSKVVKMSADDYEHQIPDGRDLKNIPSACCLSVPTAAACIYNDAAYIVSFMHTSRRGGGAQSTVICLP